MINEHDLLSIVMSRDKTFFNLPEQSRIKLQVKENDVAIIHQKDDAVLTRLVVPIAELQPEWNQLQQHKVLATKQVLWAKVVEIHNKYFPVIVNGFFSYKNKRAI